MKAAVLALLLTALPGALPTSRDDVGTMFGPICGEPSAPPIAGPHVLVRLPGMGNDRFPADTKSADAQAWFDYGLTLAR